MRVLLLTRYSRLGASSRLRFYQFIPYLAEAGIDVVEAPLFGDDYVLSLNGGNISYLSVTKSYISRLRFILKARQFDLLWVEKEMLPWIPSLFELALWPKKLPLVVDYDDAVFHRYDQHRSSLVRTLLGRKIDSVMRRADIVVVGNEYLAERARQAGARRVELLPTVVDANRYAVIEKENPSPITIGWIGQSSTVHYLDQLVNVLQKMISKHNVRIVVIGPKSVQLQNLSVDIRRWSENTEASEIQQFDIGIMPLYDSLWERGKCGYKLIQYMACGKAVVASPVGANKVIVQHGVNGFLADTEAEWCDALDTLCKDSALRRRMGEEGRKMMEQNYSLYVAAPRLAELLYSAVNNFYVG